jgi:hypothetical protein
MVGGERMKSIISNEKECFVCGIKEWCGALHRHHCINGVSNRRNSEKYGLWVWLCADHHNMSNDGVHFNHPFDVTLKKLAQIRFEEVNEGGRDEFRKIFGKSYL